MRRSVSLMMVLILAALVFAACNSKDGSGSGASGNGSRTATTSASPGTATATGAPATPAGDGVRRITTAELHDALEKGTAVLIDVRAPETYQLSHIKGSINIPETQIVARKGELPPDKLIVTYCS